MKNTKTHGEEDLRSLVLRGGNTSTGTSARLSPHHKSVQRLMLRANYVYSNLRAVPNPAGDFCTLQWMPFTAINGNSMLRVFDIKGTVVLQAAINPKTGNFILDTSSLTNGLYLVQMQTGNKPLQVKINVQH